MLKKSIFNKRKENFMQIICDGIDEEKALSKMIEIFENL